MVVLLNPVEGDQLYVPLPLASKVVLLPWHIVTSGPAFTEADEVMVTVTESLILPQEFVTVTV